MRDGVAVDQASVEHLPKKQKLYRVTARAGRCLGLSIRAWWVERSCRRYRTASKLAQIAQRVNRADTDEVLAPYRCTFTFSTPARPCWPTRSCGLWRRVLKLGH